MTAHSFLFDPLFAGDMEKAILKVTLADVVLLIAGYYVSTDLQWRADYASSLHNACGRICSYVPSFSHSILTQFFTMSRNGGSLTSPPTLDWIQVIAIAAVAVNGWLAYAYLRQKAAGRTKGLEGSPHQDSIQISGA